MSSENQSNGTSSKKAQVMGTEKASSSKLFTIIVALVVVAAAAGAAYFYMSGPATSQVASSAAEPVAKGDQIITFAAAQFDDHKARHFKHKTGDGIEIVFFILKSSDGVIRAAFDACDVCWPAGKGYAQDGDVMICRNCGRRFPSVSINEVKGGCNPAPLKRELKDGKVIIRVADIENDGRKYFDFASLKKS